MTDKQAIRRSQLKLILLFLVFLLPVLVAYVYYKNPQWQPKSTRNYGTLYKPTVRLKQFSLHTLDNKPYTLNDLRGKWSLVYIGGGDCDQACTETLIKARDGRWAQGVGATRINYYYVLTTDKFSGDLAKLQKAYPGLILLLGDVGQRQELIQQFRINTNQQLGGDNELYLVDPAGMLLMHYPFGFRHIGLMEDLKYLLQWSQIG
jgi:cytochrome oxidase Cu insertion factor (SCO1/SenC/PrrC family)